MRSLIRIAQQEEMFARDDPLKNLAPFLRRHASEVGICEPDIELAEGEEALLDGTEELLEAEY